MEQKSNGPMISAIIIIILLVIGGIFFWKTSIKNKAVNQPSSTDNSGVSGAVDVSADISGIESDLNSLDLNNLDQGL